MLFKNEHSRLEELCFSAYLYTA